MPTGMDEQCTWMSVGTLIVFVLIARELMLGRQTAMVLVPADGHPGEAAPAAALAPVRPSRPQPVDSRARTRKRKRR
jgi:hypothetical protein